MRRLALVAVLAPACASDPDRVEVCPDADSTISQGVYGLATFHTLVARTADGRAADAEFTIRMGADQYIATVTTDERGLYEYALDAGPYTICWKSDRCVDFTIGAGERARLDFSDGYWSTLNQHVGSCDSVLP